MSSTQPELCREGCGRLVIAPNIFRMCPECESKWKKESQIKHAWETAPFRQKLLVRSLQIISLLAGLLALGFIEQLFLPSWNYIWAHPRIILVLAAAIMICILSYRKSQDVKNKASGGRLGR